MSTANVRDIEAVLRNRVVPAGGAARHGVVIGIEKYQDPRLNLRCARADAEAVYRLMTDPGCGMFSADNVKLLVDEQATRENIWKALSHVRRSAREDDTVWIYFAGHGAPEQSDLYWVPFDADVDDLFATGLGGDQINRVLEEIRAGRTLMFLDCCHAAAVACKKNPTRDVLTPEQLFNRYKGKGRITFSSSDGREKSVELSDVGHGAFTYFLVKGLRGEADRGGDGVVTADELWDYLNRRVTDASAQAGNPQTPMLIGQMSHDLALTLNPAASEEKKKLAEQISAMVGLGDDRLSTEEATYLLELLGREPRSQEEKDVVNEELPALLKGTVPLKTFRRILGPVMRAKQEAKPPAAGTVKPPPIRPELLQQHTQQRQQVQPPPQPPQPPPWQLQGQGQQQQQQLGFGGGQQQQQQSWIPPIQGQQQTQTRFQWQGQGQQQQQNVTRPPQQPPPGGAKAPVDRMAAYKLAWWLGAFGGHKFALGFTGQAWTMLVISTIGVLCLGAGPQGFAACMLFCLPTSIIALIEAMTFKNMSDQQFYETYIVGKKKWF
jgi:hypothetical protein